MAAKEISILGAAKSGIGSAILAKKVGYKVFVSDYNPINKDFKEELSQLGIEWEEDGHSIDRLIQSDEIIKSPGIPDSAKLIQQLKSQKIPIISEIEFAGRFTKATKICITGSNGKTTTTLMLKHILEKAGVDVEAVGNVGKSFAKALAEKDHDVFVIELSSFQLDGMYDFKADIAVLLNITPDHLDRYDNDFQKYIDSKFRILNNQGKSEVFIYNTDDPVIEKEIKNRTIKSSMYGFSQNQKMKNGSWIENDQIQININNNKQTIMRIHDLAQQGKHNAYNSMASGIAARLLDIRKEIIRESLSDFQNVEHRLEFVAKVHGIEFINDSKATNVNSTWFALESMQKPTIWIAGGVDKGNDYSMLEGLVKQKVVGIVCLGEKNKKIHKAFGNIVNDIHNANSAQEAVRISYQLSKKGYAVLLSPACASFDLFENYEERGMKFKKAVRAL